MKQEEQISRMWKKWFSVPGGFKTLSDALPRLYCLVTTAWEDKLAFHGKSRPFNVGSIKYMK